MCELRETKRWVLEYHPLVCVYMLMYVLNCCEWFYLLVQVCCICIYMVLSSSRRGFVWTFKSSVVKRWHITCSRRWLVCFVASKLWCNRCKLCYIIYIYSILVALVEKFIFVLYAIEVCFDTKIMALEILVLQSLAVRLNVNIYIYINNNLKYRIREYYFSISFNDVINYISNERNIYIYDIEDNAI